MVAHPTPPLMTVAEYLELEDNSPIKHEYIDGHVYAMAGGTRNHAAIATNIIALLRPHLRGGTCRLYGSDMKVRIGSGRFVYPDASVTCHQRDNTDGRATFITNPCLLVEVLSPTTAVYDRGDKFAMYSQLESLIEYVLVSADALQVEVRKQEADGTWHTRVLAADDDVVLESIGVRVPLTAIYDDITL